MRRSRCCTARSSTSASAASASPPEPTRPAGGLDAIRNANYDEDALAAQGYGHERLDQLVTELLLGVR